MKKPAQKVKPAPRVVPSSVLPRIRGGDGGITASDDWETPIAGTTRVWSDDWLAPT